MYDAIFNFEIFVNYVKFLQHFLKFSLKLTTYMQYERITADWFIYLT